LPKYRQLPQITPESFLQKAIKAVPAVKYALGVGGIVAVIAIVGSFKIDFKVAVFGTVIMFVLMTILVLFARLASTAGDTFRVPILVFTWFSLLLTMATALALFTSVFKGWPLPIKSILAGEVQKKISLVNDEDARLHYVAGNNAAMDAIKFENCLLLNCEHYSADQIPMEWNSFDAKWNMAKLQWSQALNETSDPNWRANLARLILPNTGITCQVNKTSALSCFPNDSNLYRLDGPNGFSVPIYPRRPLQ
jgi:hypothetical protein